MWAVNIRWVVDFPSDLETIPSRIEIPVDLAERMDYDEIGDYLSTQTGYLHDGFDLV